MSAYLGSHGRVSLLFAFVFCMFETFSALFSISTCLLPSSIDEQSTSLMNQKSFIHYTACAMVTVVQQEISCRSGQNEQSENAFSIHVRLHVHFLPT